MKIVGWLIGILAAVLEIAALALVFRATHGGTIMLALVWHIAAAFLCRIAASRVITLSTVEGQCVLLVGLFIPLLGPTVGWLLPLGEENGSDSSSTAMLESIEQNIDHESAWIAPLLSGDYEADLGRQMSTTGFTEALRTGTLETKRDVLRKLGRLGEPRHLELLRSCLEDEESELRLCAYLELDRIRSRHEVRIAELRREAQSIEPDEDPVLAARALAILAQAHRRYAASGALDDAMARFQLSQAMQIAEQALDLHPNTWESYIVLAHAHCDERDFAAAEESLAQLPGPARARPAVVKLQARICVERRDFAGARSAAARLNALASPLPAWLQAVTNSAPLSASLTPDPVSPPANGDKSDADADVDSDDYVVITDELAWMDGK